MIPQALFNFDRAWPALDPRLDPAQIPAKLVLAGLGEADYVVHRTNASGQQGPRLLPNNPNRKLYFVPASADHRAYQSFSTEFGERIPRNVAYGCMLATIFGSVLCTAGAFTGNIWVVVAGAAIVMGAAYVMFDKRLPEPPVQTVG